MFERNDQLLSQNEGRSTNGSGLGPHGMFGGLWALLFLMTFLVAGPWAGFHGVLLGGLGLLVALHPPTARLPGVWWAFAGIFALTAAAAFLPASWFFVPEWRRGLESLGLETGSMVAIQARQAVEAYGLLAVTLFAGFWMTGHRPSPAQIRLWALVFTLGVACYAVLARFAQNSPHFAANFSPQHFGFFPNRNHSATYLSMGTICGLGCVLQAMRDKRFVILAVALAASALCLWALATWSISRAGVILTVTGGLLWVSMLGSRYLGSHGIWAIALIAITAVGLFLTTDTEVFERMTVTVEKAGTVIAAEPSASSDARELTAKPSQHFDFRIPIYLDTWRLIRDFSWTGIGAGQFYYVFSQYRDHTVIANDSDVFHPESDWLWMAAEHGIPATLALVALVILACGTSLRGIRHGRDRALRASCLVAAMLVPIHGIFDVPGHRITLALTAALLFSLSLQNPSNNNGESHPPPRAWPFRIAALALLAASIFLIRAQWFEGPQPALTSAKTAVAEARRLYQQSQAIQKPKSPESPTVHQSANTDELLKKALLVLKDAEKIAPLDREIPWHQGFLALYFNDLRDDAKRAFKIERSLDPTWVKGPVRQALAWSNSNTGETVRLWNEALRRARLLDQRQPGGLGAETRARAQIRDQTRGKPFLEELRLEHVGD